MVAGIHLVKLRKKEGGGGGKMFSIRYKKYHLIEIQDRE
jgi:hypothetical protein